MLAPLRPKEFQFAFPYALEAGDPHQAVPSRDNSEQYASYSNWRVLEDSRRGSSHMPGSTMFLMQVLR